MKANRKSLGTDERGNGELIGTFIVGAIALLIGLALVLPVSDQAKRASSSANTTSSQDAMLDVTGLVYVAAIVVSIVAVMIIAALRKFA